MKGIITIEEPIRVLQELTTINGKVNKMSKSIEELKAQITIIETDEIAAVAEFKKLETLITSLQEGGTPEEIAAIKAQVIKVGETLKIGTPTT